jgi:hypothetical protein
MTGETLTNEVLLQWQINLAKMIMADCARMAMAMRRRAGL